VIDPHRTETLYAGINSNGVFKSTDGGGTWVAANVGLAIGVTPIAIVIDPGNPSNIYVVTDRGVSRSANGGLIWTPLISPGNALVATLAIDPSATATIYAGDSLGVHKSKDEGVTWEEANFGLSAFSIGTVTLDPNNPSTIFVSANGSQFSP